MTILSDLKKRSKTQGHDECGVALSERPEVREPDHCDRYGVEGSCVGLVGI